MQEIKTQYGLLKGISRYSLYENGQPDSLCLDSPNEIITKIGRLVPRYEDSTGRRKSTKCLSFYMNGRLKSVDLQEKTSILTSLGLIDAELVTFYEDGSIKRIFPQNGALSGFWSEGDEASLSSSVSFRLLGADFSLKVNSIFFYPDGNVKSISLVPGETALIPSPFGEIPARIGFSLAPDGSLFTLEPAKPVAVETPLGTLHAFNTYALGIHADNNSLVFCGEKLTELVTSTDIIKITDNAGKRHYLAPGIAESMLDPDETETVPMKIIFEPDQIIFITASVFTIAYTDIAEIKINTLPLEFNGCTDCSTCGKCN